MHNTSVITSKSLFCVSIFNYNPLGNLNVLFSIIQNGGDSGHLEISESSKLSRKLSDLAEILQGDTYEGRRVSKLEPEVEFRRQGAFLKICGHISAANQNIFTKFRVYAENGVPQCAE